ncbi:MAG: helix-turn-helix transcriptional regulator [Firmicutes bacterium]|nr:helix-turn-helix transcriptional regulator [Bacillota bacterium]
MNVVKLYSELGSQKEVAEHLNYSERGISTILSRLYDKLGILGFNGLFIAALRYNLFCRCDFYDEVYDMGLDI